MIILPSTFHTSLGYSTNIPQKFPLMFSLTRIQTCIHAHTHILYNNICTQASIYVDTRCHCRLLMVLVLWMWL